MGGIGDLCDEKGNSKAEPDLVPRPVKVNGELERTRVGVPLAALGEESRTEEFDCQVSSKKTESGIEIQIYFPLNLATVNGSLTAYIRKVRMRSPPAE
jgi:hypothetical protein